MEQITKVCSKCGRELTLDMFNKSNDGKFGVKSQCKECCAANGRRYRAANPEKERERQKRYRAANPEKKRELVKRYRAANLEKVRERARVRLRDLTTGVVRGKLILQHFPPESITPELIEYKRTQLKLYREIKKPTDQ